jgi:hypothetical protein
VECIEQRFCRCSVLQCAMHCYLCTESFALFIIIVRSQVFLFVINIIFLNLYLNVTVMQQHFYHSKL